MPDNWQIVESLYAAFGRGDIAAVLAALTPDVAWTEAEGFPYAGTHIGPDAVLGNVFVKLGTEWEAFAAVPHEFIAERDMVVALGDYGGTYIATRKSIAVPFVHVWKLKDGKVVSFQQHTDTAVVQQALQ